MSEHQQFESSEKTSDQWKLEDIEAVLNKLQRLKNGHIKDVDLAKIQALLVTYKNQFEASSELETLKLENQLKSKRIEKLMQAMQERERRIVALKRYEFSFRTLSAKNQQYEKEIDALKKTVSEQETLQKELEGQKLHSLQLERAVGHLRGKVEEYELTENALEQDYQASEKKTEALEIEIAAWKEKEASLKEIVSRLENANRDLQEELASLTAQLKKSNAAYRDRELEFKKKTEDMVASKKQLESTVEENFNLRDKLEEKEKERLTLENELESMKTSLVKGLKEARDVKQYYQYLINEKTHLLKKTQQLQKKIDEITDQMRKNDQIVKEYKLTIASLEKEKFQFLEQKNLLELEIQRKDESLTSLTEQIQKIQITLKTAKKEVEEKEISVVIAKQQFAKKALEVSKLTETKENLRDELTRAKDELMQIKQALSTSRATLELHLKKFKELEVELKVQDTKHKRALEQIDNLKRQRDHLLHLEEKHEKMQNLLQNLGHLMGSPVSITQPLGFVSGSSKIAEDTGPKEEKPQEKKTDSPTLFDKKDSPKFKKDLFDS